MNHGHCKNCWWWKWSHPLFDTTNLLNLAKELEIGGVGKCYMQNGDDATYAITRGDSYCPDYVNRKKEEKRAGTLDEFIKTL